MTKALKLLVVEDSEDDAELVIRLLRRGGFAPQHERVESAAAMTAALQRQAWDAVVSDYNMPGFSGLDALRILRATELDIPFILISGTVGEEIAVDALKAGAADYVLKINLSRLASVLERELKEAAIRAEHRQAQRKLIESEAGLRHAQDMARLAHVITRPDGSFENWSESLPKLIGVAPAQMPGSTREWLKRIHAEDRELFRTSAIEAGRRGTRMSVEYRIRHEDGTWIHVSQVTEPIDAPAGAAGGKRWFGTLQDISERKRAEQELRRFQFAMDMSSDSIYLTDVERMRFVYVNNVACRRLGYPRDKLLQMGPEDVLGKDRAEIRREYDAVIAAGEPGMRFEGRFARSDLGEGWTEIHRVALLADGKWLIVTIGRDITERKRAEDDLQRFRLALDNSADIILIIDRATMRHVDVNQTACKLLGYTRDELLRMGPIDILPVEQVELEKTYDELIASPSLPSGMRSYYRCKDGSQLAFESTRRIQRSGDTWLVVAISRDIRERLASERALRDSEVRFRQTFELAASGMAHVALDGRFLRVNRKLCEMLGYQEEELIGHSVKDLSHPDERDLTDPQRARLRSQEINSASFERCYLRKDGSVIWVSLTVALARNTAPEPDYEIGVFEDITERKQDAERIRRLNRVYAVLSGINSAIVHIRERDELFSEACRIAVSEGGFTVARVLELDANGRARIAASSETDARQYQRIVDKYNNDPEHAPSLIARALRSGQPLISNDVASDARIPDRAALTKDGNYSLALLPLIVEKRVAGALVLRAREAGTFNEEEMRLLLELVSDISFALEVMEKQKKLDYLAYYDALTGLANRTLFHERLIQYVRAAQQGEGKLALVLADIERFKTINDSLGRQAGDALLKQVAERLARAADPANIARLGGDHFALVLPEIRGRSEIGRRIERIWRECFAQPFRLDDTELRVSAKAGIALFPSDGDGADRLFANAEAALQKAKRTGDRFQFHSREMTDSVAGQLSLENNLRRALENEEFVLHYQPKVDSETRSIVGVEALIRWQSPDLGLVPPMKFIPLMEETGLILPVGAWALKRASLDHRNWVDQGLKAPRVAVNVSPIQLRQRDFVATLEQAIFEGVAPTGIDLEITESLIMEDVKGNVEKLNAARQLGVQIAIDDFGTGYSSLGYLAKLPVQTLKIDRSFIITMLKDPDTMTLVQTIISLAHSLRLKVVAEGVDAEEQAKMLRLLRCDEMQGYLFSKPVPFEQMMALLQPDGAAGKRPDSGV